MGDNIIASSQEYKSFRSTVPQRKTIVDEDGEKAWTYYDAGPRSVRCPVIFLPPASGSADVYFKQMLSLSAVGYRVISVEYPVYWSLPEWCEGFQKFLNYLHLDKIHIFGASLGGYLAQVFAEYTCNSPRIHSLVLCNAFIDTSVFKQEISCQTFWMLPAIVLKKMVMGSFDKGMVDQHIADSIDFMVEKLDSIGQSELASRLTLNCATSYVEPQKISQQHIRVTLLDVFDDCALSQKVRDEMYKCYPDAKRAHLKSGGNFPYLSRSDEVNVYIQIHLKDFQGTRYSAMGENEPQVTEDSL